MPALLLPADSAALRVNALCFLVLCLEGYDVSSLGFATPSLIEAWHVSAPQFTTMVTLGAVSMLVGSMRAGVLGDRLGRKPVLIGCVAIFGIFSLLIAWSTGLISLTLLRCLASLGLGGGVPLTIALATDYAPTRSPRRLVILMSTGLAVGSTASGFISRLFVTTLGWGGNLRLRRCVADDIDPATHPVPAGEQSIAHRARARRGAQASCGFSATGLAPETIVLWIVRFPATYSADF